MYRANPGATVSWFCFSGCVPDNVQEHIELPTLKDDGIEINFEY